jgi:hypothetical protein
MVGWRGDPSQLVEALVESRWFDRCRERRLVVHDLGDHADDASRKLLVRRRLMFVVAVPDDVRTMSGQVPDTDRSESAEKRTYQAMPGQARSRY